VARTPRPETQPPRARLFVALDLPDPARTALTAWRASALAGRRDLRAVSHDALHVTLAFLGHRPEAEIAPIADALAVALEQPLAPARLTPLAARPVPRRRPRLFALDLEDHDARAAALQAAIARALAEAGYYKREAREFWPHVTVARVSRGENRPAPLTAPPPAEPFSADQVALYRSHLGRGPARYEPLATWRLRRPSE
jgi:RNA 2',3'-cyclic 3'-phosphodiesterase